MSSFGPEVADVPEGWGACPLPEVIVLGPPKPPAGSLDEDASVTFLPMAAVSENGKIVAPQTRPFGQVRKGYTAFAEGDVLLAKITPCFENGKAAIATALVNGLGFGSSEFHVLRSKGALHPKFVFHYFHQPQFRVQAAERMSGTAGQARVTSEFMKEVAIPIPPLSEQRRIVAKIEALLAEVDAARERLAKVPAILKRFRQSVLAAACSGRLTEEWREGNVSPASDATGSGNLPRGWSLRDLESVCASDRPISYGVLKPGPFQEGGIPLLRITDMVGGSCRVAGAHRISRSLSDEYRRTQLTGGEVVVSLVGTIGRVALVTPDCKGANVHRNLGVIAPSDKAFPAFLTFALQSRAVQQQISEVTGGANQPLLNLRDVRRLQIPLPPLDEQKEIARRVEALFKVADSIEKQVATATARADKITQAVLAKAFRGELVPTEAELAREEGREYEPASVLLERIAKERATSGPKDSKKRPKRDAA